MIEAHYGGEGASSPLPAHDVLLRHRNPGASMDLIIPVVMECNTSDDALEANVAANSALNRDWIGTSTAHDLIAVLCGSGPSLEDGLELLRAMNSDGRHVLIALNGAASYLARNDVMPDFQFIADARPETASLLGPALHHIFASQVDPSLFERMPEAMLVQVGAPSLADRLPDHDSEYAILISHGSSGNVSLGLAYAMGFREIHCFGFDSSHRGEAGHAAHQEINDGEPGMMLERGGKTYRASLTMRQQADVFPLIARQLQALGCAIRVHGDGLLPDVWNATLTEKQKYEMMWSLPQYRVVAPGEEDVEAFLAIARPAGCATVLDFGCGTGRASVALSRAGLAPVLIDFASNCRDLEAQAQPFFERDLTQPIGLHGGFGFCTDVMEHIPPADAELALANMFEASPNIYFRIDTEADVCGALINQTLHLNIKTHAEWLATLRTFGAVEHESAHQGFSRFYVRRQHVHA